MGTQTALGSGVGTSEIDLCSLLIVLAERSSTVTIKDNITIHKKIKRKGKLGRYYSTVSLYLILNIVFAFW